VGDFPDLQLVLIGGGPLNARERDHIKRLQMSTRISQWTVSDLDMPAAYSGARACIFPSLYEGFGLPVLEAMACGVPAVLAESSAFPEVGGDAATYFSPGSSADLVTAVKQIFIEDERRMSLIDLGKERSSQFTWRRSAQIHAEIYGSLVNG
jgi:glycosyltransferase involved in cell wall biosynthesis